VRTPVRTTTETRKERKPEGGVFFSGFRHRIKKGCGWDAPARAPFWEKDLMSSSCNNASEGKARWWGPPALGLLLFVSGVGVGCTDVAHASPLVNARTSPEALAEAALEALVAKDEEILVSLLVTREEYETLLWPSLPDKDHVPFEFVWSLTSPRSRKARREVMSEYGGLPLELVSVDLGAKVEAYDAFTLYQEARMTVRRMDTGREGLIPLMDVVVEMDGVWKFLNYGEDL
jgi:hypothetical protein